MDHSSLLIFMHVLKTAGTTLNATLARLYGAQRILYVADCPHPKQAAERYRRLPDAERAKIAIFAGHFYDGTQEFLPHPSRQFTFLREPVDREISQFHEVRRMPNGEVHQKYLQNVSEKLEMRTYFSSGFYHDLDNLQTRLMAGLHGENEPPPFGACNEDTLTQAIAHMDTHFDFVGLTEDYDRSVMLLKRMYGWKMPFYVRRNVTAERAHESISEDVLEIVRHNTRFDRQLYDYAAQKFLVRVAVEGPAFEKDVRRFQMLNRLWTWKYGLWNARRLAGQRVRAAAPSSQQRSV